MYIQNSVGTKMIKSPKYWQIDFLESQGITYGAKGLGHRYSDNGWLKKAAKVFCQPVIIVYW